MNAFEKRRAHRALLRKARSDDDRANKVAEVWSRARRYEAAFEALYGYVPSVRYVKGWYWTGMEKYRASEFDKRIARLEALWHIQQNPPVEIEDEI